MEGDEFAVDSSRLGHFLNEWRMSPAINGQPLLISGQHRVGQQSLEAADPLPR